MIQTSFSVGNGVFFCKSILFYVTIKKRAEGGADMRDEAWIEAGRRMILRRFYIRESMRIFLMFVMYIVVSILWAKYTGKGTVFLIAIGITVLAVLRMVTIGSREFRNTFADLYHPRQEQIIVDFLQPHTIYRLFGGEVHMLSDAIVCRSGAKLLLILPEEVDVIKTMKYSGESAFVRGVWITTDSMKKYRLEFKAGQQQNIKYIVMWLKHKKPEIIWQRNS